MSEARTALISQLLPVVSGFRHSKNLEARNCAELLQIAVRDLERLNDIEMACVSYNSNSLRPMSGPAEEFFDRLNQIFSRE